MANKSDYFGLSYLVSIILAIFPFTSWICGAVARLQDGKKVAFILRLLFGFTIVWLIDLVYMIAKKQIWRFLEV